MTHRPHRSATTHTIEMAQLAELTRLLESQPRPTVTAAQLGMAGAELTHVSAVDRLPESAVLSRLCWDGPPAWPYIHGHFASGPLQPGTLVADLHTEALRTLSHLLHVRQAWGL